MDAVEKAVIGITVLLFFRALFVSAAESKEQVSAAEERRPAAREISTTDALFF